MFRRDAYRRSGRDAPVRPRAGVHSNMRFAVPEEPCGRMTSRNSLLVWSTAECVTAGVSSGATHGILNGDRPSNCWWSSPCISGCFAFADLSRIYRNIDLMVGIGVGPGKQTDRAFFPVLPNSWRQQRIGL